MDREELAQRILQRVAAEVRPRLDKDNYEGGYDCCGCSTYAIIVEDIETIVREEGGLYPLIKDSL